MTSIVAKSFDRQVADKIGTFFAKPFLPGIKKMVDEGLPYAEVKRRLKGIVVVKDRLDEADRLSLDRQYTPRGTG